MFIATKLLIIHYYLSIKFLGSYQSGQLGLTVTQLSFDFGGSNPSLPTTNLKIEKFENLKINFQIFKSSNFQINFAKVAQLIEH